MTLELAIFLLALAPIAFACGRGWMQGASTQVRRLLAMLFATLAALRFAHPVAAFLFHPPDSPAGAAAVFGALFLLGWLLAAFAFRLKAPVYQAVQANIVDQALGAFCGLCSGALASGVLLLVLAFALPGFSAKFDAEKFPLRLDQLPLKVFRVAETAVSSPPVPAPNIQDVAGAAKVVWSVQ